MKDNSKEQSIEKIPVKQTMLLKGKIKLKTLKENNIKSGSIIMLNIIDE